MRRSKRGLSEIVGTLILVLIVVSAATLLAAFVASYQKQLQAEETLSHDQSLESIQILGLTTTVSGGAFTSFAFTLASEYVNPSGILDVWINGMPLLDFAWDNVTTNTFGTYNVGQSVNNLIILPFDQVLITLCLVATCSTQGGPLTFSFLSASDVPVPNHYIKFDVFTQLHNDFTRVYLPPTPLAVVSEINPSGNNPITLLDGSMSFQPGGNGSIVNWDWSVAGGGLPASSSASLTAPTNTSSPWLGTGTAEFTVPDGFSWESGDSIALTALTDLTDTAAMTDGCTGIAAANITADPTGETVSTTTLTVPFSYSVTDPGCSSAPSFSLASGGATLSLGATGEEVEISPSLSEWDPTVPYLVTLAVTNSDGLTGTITVSYIPPS